MKKSTCPSRAISEQQKKIAVTVGRFIAIALLVSAVLYAAVSGMMRAEVAAQSGYSKVSLSAGASPSAAKIGDLDDDGRNDIAVANLQGSLQLFFSNGAGSFEQVSLNGLWPSSSNTLDLDIGDLNGDGRNDIAVAVSTQTGTVSVLLNQGNRTFGAPVNYNTCNFSKGVAIGDLDRDSDNDLADISQCNKASVLVNNSQGSFSFNGTYGNGYASRSITLADFNRDGFKDLVYLNNGQGSNGNVTVLLNNGNATFGPPRVFWVWDMPDDLAVGDFEGDGNIDVATANAYYGLVFVLIGGGDGNFISYSELPGGDTPTGITTADFNGDGRLDYAVISWGTSSLSIFINQGYYTYATPITHSVGQHPVDIAAGNLDSDSLPDLVTVNQGSGNITVLLSEGGAAPPPPPPPPAVQINLTVSTRRTIFARLVDLNWSGATSSSVDIYRNGSRIATVSNNGSYTDQFSRRASGTFKYKVCVAGNQQCSNEATISF